MALPLPPNGAFWLIPILGSKRSQTFAEVPYFRIFVSASMSFWFSSGSPTLMRSHSGSP